MRKLILMLFIPVLLCSCDFQEYQYKCKIYYLDGSTDTIVYQDSSDPFIWSNRDDGCYLSVNGDYIRGVDRVDILSKKPIK
jgi:hypothetical protein